MPATSRTHEHCTYLARFRHDKSTSMHQGHTHSNQTLRAILLKHSKPSMLVRLLRRTFNSVREVKVSRLSNWVSKLLAKFSTRNSRRWCKFSMARILLLCKSKTSNFGNGCKFCMRPTSNRWRCGNIGRCVWASRNVCNENLEPMPQ